MTWLGKILTIAVMLAAVAGMYFTVQAFVTRTNWKVRADEYQAALKKSEDARKEELARFEAKVADLSGQVALGQKQAAALKGENAGLAKARADADANLKTAQAALAGNDTKGQVLQTNVDSTLKELGTVRQRLSDLENAQQALVLKTENALKAEVEARGQAKLALALADDYARKVEDLTAQVSQLRATGGSAQAAVLGSLTKPPPPLLPNTRGEVTAVAGNQLVVSLGIDAGLAPNTVLEVSREDGTYLGTAKVTDAQSLFPKQAIVTFTPKAGNVPLNRLPASALPREKDLVRPAGR